MNSLIDLTNALQTYREENEIFNNTLLSFEYTCPCPVLFAEMALASPQAYRSFWWKLLVLGSVWCKIWALREQGGSWHPQLDAKGTCCPTEVTLCSLSTGHGRGNAHIKLLSLCLPIGKERLQVVLSGLKPAHLVHLVQAWIWQRVAMPMHRLVPYYWRGLAGMSDTKKTPNAWKSSRNQEPWIHRISTHQPLWGVASALAVLRFQVGHKWRALSFHCFSPPFLQGWAGSIRLDLQAPDTTNPPIHRLIPESNSHLSLSSLREAIKPSEGKGQILHFLGCKQKDSRCVYLNWVLLISSVQLPRASPCWLAVGQKKSIFKTYQNYIHLPPDSYAQKSFF